jgi:hypothetical protein
MAAAHRPNGVSCRQSTLLSSSAIKESGVESTPGVAVALEVVSPVPKDASKLWPELTSALKGAVGPDALFLAESSERFHAFFFQGDSAPTSAKFENVTLGLLKVRGASAMSCHACGRLSDCLPCLRLILVNINASH